MDKKMDIANRAGHLKCELERFNDYAKLDGTGLDQSRMIWYNCGLLTEIMIEGTVYDYDPEALRTGYANMLKLINHSLTTEEWRKWSNQRPKYLRAQDPDEKQRPDENGKWPEWGEPRPEAWVCPNLALIDDRWWRESVIDKAEVAAIFDRKEDWALGSTLVGIDTAERLLSIGAYHLIEPMQHTVNSSGGRFKRDFEPADRLGMLLASDPGQLHDPKSPVRKSARSIMKRNMESKWFMRSGGWMPFHWLRTFEWREGESGLSPRESMLRAYAYMPDVEPPPGIAREVEQLRKIPI